MRKNLYIFLIIIATFLLQTTFGSLLRSLIVTPDLLLILIVSMGFMRGKKAGMYIGFVSGILIDLIYGDYIGLTALLYMYIGYMSGFLFKVFFDNDIRIPMAAVGLGDLFYNLAVYLAEFAFRNRLAFRVFLMRRALPATVCTMLFAIPFYGIFYWLNKKITASELEEEQSPWLRR